MRNKKVEAVVEKKKPVRRVFGRLKGIEVHGKIFTVELTKAGVRVRERCHRRVDVAGFDKVCAAGGVEVQLKNGESFTFALCESGLEVRQGSRKAKLVEWEQLANLGRSQMELFPKLAAEAVA